MTTVNNIQLWRLPDDLGEVRRVLAADGRLSVTVHAGVLVRYLATSTIDHARERVVGMLNDAALVVRRCTVARSRTGKAIYIVATAG